jgi:hypothetical protein
MDVRNEEGQSIVEFLLMLPLMFGIAMTLLWVNSAIQIGIVDQQYARAQVLFLAFNSPFYPEYTKQVQMVEQGTNQMVMGVSDNAIPDGATIVPKATTQQITRNSIAKTASNENRAEPKDRSIVRVRNTVTLCTGNVALSSGTGFIHISRLQEGMTMNYICGGQLQYEQ